MILLMGGTKDARKLVSSLCAAFPGIPLIATAVSDYGAELLRSRHECTVLQGALDAGMLERLIRDRGVRVLVDATHPFAVQASGEAQKAANATGVPYLRCERPAAGIPAGAGVFFADGFTAAAQMAAKMGNVLFLTIGTRHLSEFMAALPAGKEVVARVLPDAGSINQCRELGLAPASIVAMQGPVSRTLNRALFAEYRADVIVSKESGEAGGTVEKVAAARELKIPVILISRPSAAPGLTASEVIEELKKVF
ncbi:MAG: precorrin-6A reductase [Dethiobacter sp.]|jgi:precorrin-6A/cobalt-precorrin-6A reductase|nr:precorrin-6A reductase [Dethiobacter sp.]